MMVNTSVKFTLIHSRWKSRKLKKKLCIFSNQKKKKTNIGYHVLSEIVVTFQIEPITKYELYREVYLKLITKPETRYMCSLWPKQKLEEKKTGTICSRKSVYYQLWVSSFAFIYIFMSSFNEHFFFPHYI